MNTQTRIAQLEKNYKPIGRAAYERAIEVNEILEGICRDIRQAAAGRCEPEPEGEALRLEIQRVISEVKNGNEYNQ